MKTVFPILIAVALAAKLLADETSAIASPKKIGAAEATNYYDQTVIVTGKVVQVTIRPKVTFLNLDEKFPDSPLAIVIFHGHSGFYGDANALRGKSIEIRGKVKNYHDRAEMILDNAKQLTVLDSTNAVSAPAISTNAPPAEESTNLSEIM